MNKVKLIETTGREGIECPRCKAKKSVKYLVEVDGKEVPVCNKCVLEVVNSANTPKTLCTVSTEDLARELVRRNQKGEEVWLKSDGGTFHIDRFGMFHASLDTPMGELVADVEATEKTGTGYNGVFVGLREKSSGDYFDLTAARVTEEEPEKVQILNWTDPFTEDYTSDAVIHRKEMQASINQD